MYSCFLGYVDHYSDIDGHYYIRIPEFGMYSPPIDAYLVSPTPDGGLKGAPTIDADTEVIVTKIQSTYYILGFPQRKGPIVHNSYFPVRPTIAGETVMRDALGHQYGINKDGSFFAYVERFANFVLNPILRRLTMSLGNLRINFPAGSIEYAYDPQAKNSIFKTLIYKATNLAMTQPGANTPDYIKLRAGDLSADSDKHLAEIIINQDHTGTTPAFTSTTKLGKQNDGTWLDIETSTGAANPVTYSVTMNNTGVTQFNSAQGNNTISLTADINNGIVAAINGKKAILNIDTTGNITVTTQAKIVLNAQSDVTLKLATAGKLKLGGTGNEQPLVTKAWVDQVFENHMHPSASPGAPSPPLPIPPPPVTQDAATNFYTYTTTAE